MHPQKNKWRVVLDASARFPGVSLNDRLFPGPNLSHSFIDVLVRFCQERVAFIADLECMFYQGKSPGSTGFCGGLKVMWVSDAYTYFWCFEFSCSRKVCIAKIDSGNAENFSSETLMTVKCSFYVDKCLKSVSSVEEGIVLAEELRKLTQKGGFPLMPWISNSQDVLDSIPASERAKIVKEVDLSCEELPSKRALGVESDVFGFHVNVPKKPATQQGILSIVSLAYYPLGMTAPVTLNGKMIVQDLCHLKLGWDDCIPDGSSGCKLCPVWMILWSQDVISQRILECYFPWSFIISLMHVSLVTDAFLTYTSQTSMVRCIVPSPSASHMALSWSKWLSLRWSWLLQFSQLGLMSKIEMNLTLLPTWATAIFGQTVPLCWVTWEKKGPGSTSLLQTGWLWFENIHHLLNGIMCHLVLTQQTMLPEVWMKRPFFNVTNWRIGLGFCGVPRKSGQCNHIVMVLMTMILSSKWPYVLLMEEKCVTSFQ